MTLRGRYEGIVFTWRSHLAGEGSRVTLTFAEAPHRQTRLTLEHVGLADTEIRRKHDVGWSHILTELSGMTSAPRPLDSPMSGARRAPG